MRAAIRTAVFAPAVAAVVLVGVVWKRAGGLSILEPAAYAILVLTLAGIASWALGRRVESVEEAASAGEARAARADARRERLAAAVRGMSEGVLVTDADGLVAFANAQWRRLFGVTGEIEGATVIELSRQAALDRMVSATLETKQSQRVELELPPPNPATLLLTSAPVGDNEGVVVVAQDVTAFLRHAEIRRDFVANVSHELKTPLSAIRGFAETLLDGAVHDADAGQVFLDRILRQCSRLEALLYDLLTLSRLEHAGDKKRRVPIDLEAIVSEALEVVGERMSEKRLELVMARNPVPLIDGDPVALERLCVNLLDNAVKYNRIGGKIEVKLLAGKGEVVLEVADTGIGIPAGSLDRLFERFYRVDKGRSREEGGTGLGLAIVKHAAQIHGGTVEVESELGKGSVFRIRLPAAGGLGGD